MSLTPTIIQNRRRRRQKPSPIARLGLGSSVALGLLISLLSAVSSLVYATLTSQLPSLDLLPLYFEPPNGLLLHPTQLLDRSGTHIILTLSNPALTERKYLPVSQLPEEAVHALLAAIEPGFWVNPAFSWKGLIQDTHLTLAQKIAREMLLEDELPGIRRNIREKLIAAQIIQRFGREKILEWYLNTLKFGPLIYGIDAAAQVYFGKPATKLSLAEAVALAALAEAPEINPLIASQALEERRNRILQEMLIQGWINSEEALHASQEKLSFQPLRELSGPLLAFAKLVFDQLASHIPYEKLAHGGYRIITTLDYDLQMQSICASESLLARLQGQTGEISAPDGSPCLTARLIPSITNLEATQFDVDVEMIVLDPSSGQILSLVNNPQSASITLPAVKHDPGTLLTPFLYLTAFARGFSPGSMVWDLPPKADSASNNSLEEAQSYHGPVRLRIALANDYPGPARQITNQIGYENFIRTLRQLGFESEAEISLFEAAQAYSVLASQGVKNGQWISRSNQADKGMDVQPTAVLHIEDELGKVWLDWSSPSRQSLISPQLAFLVNHVLSDETARWVSLGHPNPLEIGRPVSAKIGSTDSLKEEWTIGYTPQRLAGIWMGVDIQDARTLPHNLSASLWHAIMQYATRALPAESWTIPPGVKTVRVCDPSGLIPTENCPTIVTEVFLEENLPTQFDNLYRKFQINRETGKLATVFTPPELIEERVFLSLPAEALSWAQANQLPVPPDTYDAIYTTSQSSSAVQITYPVIFQHIGGKISIIGSATGDDFKFYRLQVGKGLNPQAWIQIGQDSDQPVINGVLGVWDTQGLSGLYAVQLLVVRTNQRVDRFVTQVTVDNQPPQVSLTNPPEGQVFWLSKKPSLLFQVEASDDLEIKQVHFVLDGKLLASLSKPPYALPWQIPPVGRHILRVVAVDLAGNKSETVATFEVK